MKNWMSLMLIAACFVVVGLVDSPEYYSFDCRENSVINEPVQVVENSVENPAEPVYTPSPISWR